MAPTPPTGLVVTFPSATRAVLTWKASVASKGAFVLYRVLYAIASTKTWALGPLTTGLSAPLTGLHPKTKYDFIVEASDVMGTSVSAIIQVTTPAAGTPPGSVQNLTLSNVAASGLTISWNPPSSGDTPFTYQVQMLAPGASSYANVNLATNQTSENISGLSPFSTYSFRVVTSNATGNNTSGSVSTTTLALIPSSPGVPTVTGSAGQTTVALSWPASATGSQPITYQVFLATPSGSGNFTGGPTTTSLSTTVTGLQPATSYDFEIVASNSAGSSQPSGLLSNVVTSGVSVAPSTPTNLTAGTPGPTSIPFTWSQSATGTPPVSYVLQYRVTPTTLVTPNGVTGLTSGTPTTTTIPLTWTAPSVGTLPISYNIMQSPHGANSFSLVGNSSVANFTVTGLTPATQYDFEIVPTNQVGTGPASAIATATTASAATVPGTPAAISAGSPTSSSVTVTWAQPASGGVVQGYQVLFKLTTASSYTNFITVPVCTPGNGSIIQNGTWTISTGGVIQVNGVPAVGVPANVVQLTFINGLFWQENASGNWYSEAGNTGNWAGPTTTPPWSMTVTGLSSSTAYDFEVAAVNNVGVGAPTAPAVVTTTSSTILTDGVALTQDQVNAIASAIETQQSAEVPGGETFGHAPYPQNFLIGDTIIATAAGVQMTGNVGSLVDKDNNTWTLVAGTTADSNPPAWWWGGIALNGVLQWGGYNIAIRLLNDGTVWVEEAKQGGWWSLTAFNEGATKVYVPDPGPGPNN